MSAVLFERRDLAQYTKSLAAYVPNDPLFVAKDLDGTNLNKLLRGLAGEFFRVNGSLKEYSEDLIPDQTIKFIDEWENTLGIPDDCFDGAGSIDERRLHVLVKIASLGVQTEEDFEALALQFGVVVDVHPGIEVATVFPITFPAIFIDVPRFTIVVDFFVDVASQFDYTFPLLFGNNEILILECLFSKLKPANCDLIFRQV